ncbi:universal stress protein [Listeria aquatica]|uniref:universal stress protein n=1 Tax=Listeria aquatica TaxID=1494960 RepID=UPI003F6E4856
MMKEYGRILTAVDGSESGEAAFFKAVQVALRNHAELLIVTVVDTLYFANVTAADGGTTVNQFTETSKQLLEDYRKRAEEMGLSKVNAEVVYGSPKARIVEIAEEDFHPDLIVVGAVGQSRLARMLLGSVASYVTIHAPCDVLVERESISKE